MFKMQRTLKQKVSKNIPHTVFFGLIVAIFLSLFLNSGPAIALGSATINFSPVTPLNLTTAGIYTELHYVSQTAQPTPYCSGNGRVVWDSIQTILGVTPTLWEYQCQETLTQNDIKSNPIYTSETNAWVQNSNNSNDIQTIVPVSGGITITFKSTSTTWIREAGQTSAPADTCWAGPWYSTMISSNLYVTLGSSPQQSLTSTSCPGVLETVVPAIPGQKLSYAKTVYWGSNAVDTCSGTYTVQMSDIKNGTMWIDCCASTTGTYTPGQTFTGQTIETSATSDTPCDVLGMF